MPRADVMDTNSFWPGPGLGGGRCVCLCLFLPFVRASPSLQLDYLSSAMVYLEPKLYWQEGTGGGQTNNNTFGPRDYYRLYSFYQLVDLCIYNEPHAGYGNFDIAVGPFLAHYQLQPTPHCPCTMVSLLPIMLIGS